MFSLDDLDILLHEHTYATEIKSLIEEDANLLTSFDGKLMDEEAFIDRFGILSDNIPAPSFKNKRLESKLNEITHNSKLMLEIIRLRECGERRRKIARELGITPKRVYKLERQALNLIKGGK